MRGLIRLAVTRRITVLMVVAAIIVLGVVSWTRTPVDLLPDITFPAAAVTVSYPGAGPEEVEMRVTRVLESALGALSNISEVQSISTEGSSLVILMFGWGADMDAAAIDIRESLGQVSRFLPAEAGDPMVLKFDPSMLPVMTVAVASDRLALTDMTRLGNSLAQRLERLDGVASVDVSGGTAEQIRVVVDRSKLEQYGIPLSSVTGALRMANLNLPGGSVAEEGTRWLIRTVVRTETIEDIGDLVVGVRTAQVPGQPPMAVPVQLRDVAGISIEPEERATLTRVNGKPSLSLSVSKRSDANTVLVAGQVRAELERLASEYPDLTFITTDDQSFFIEMSINSLVRNALIGGALALLVLLFFLRNLLSTLVIALSIPISLISTFILMHFSGLTVNMMTLGGLALGVGMLVDNSVVVIESIHRHLEDGKAGPQAAFHGAREVGMAITASTLTTVAVFLPVVFVGGIAGVLFKELALTVSFSLLASLGVALTAIPMFASMLLRPGSAGRTLQATGIAPLYRRALTGVLKHRFATLAVVAVLFVASLLAIPRLGGDFLPAFDEGQGTITITLPDDAVIDDTEAVVHQVEQLLLAQSEVDVVSARLGTVSGRMGRTRQQPAPNRARITFLLKPIEERGIPTSEFIARIETELPRIPGVTFNVAEQSMAGGAGMLGSSGIEVELRGPDLERLAGYAVQLEDAIASLGYVESTSNSLAARDPEVQVMVDIQRAMAMGVNPAMVGNAIRSSFQGETATRITSEGYDLAVFVQLEEQYRDSIEDVASVILSVQGDRVIRVGDIAELVMTEGPQTINRRDNQRIVTVTAQLAEGKDLLSSQGEVRNLLDDLGLPADYTASFRGQALQMEEAFSEIFLALALAIALVYMVMASQFESLVHPFTVMFTMPLAAIGVIFTLLLTGHSLSVPSLIGVVVLVGVSVNNAIVMIDYINQLRGRGLNLESALLSGGEARLRPILMTTLTTVLAMIPLALGRGTGSEMQQPLAVTIMGGLAVGSLLTLFVIPLVYATLDRLLPRATNIVREDLEM